MQHIWRQIKANWVLTCLRTKGNILLSDFLFNSEIVLKRHTNAETTVIYLPLVSNAAVIW